jgi:sugar phosphate isomerase/epimerase
MSTHSIRFSLFTKPWKQQSVPQLAELVQSVGFDGIEFPLRDGYQVQPSDAAQGLPRLAEQLDAYGLKVFSVASTLDEPVFAACQQAGIPLIRIMQARVGKDGYESSLRDARRELEAVAVLCEKYGVSVGIQQHQGNFIIDSAGLYQLIDQLHPSITAVWDAAHDALTGQEPEVGLDLLWERLSMVNLKNAYYVRTNGPEAENAKWARHFTTGRHGLSDWPRVVAHLKNQKYSGVICLTAQYNDEARTLEYVRQDLAYVKELFARSEKVTP